MTLFEAIERSRSNAEEAEVRRKFAYFRRCRQVAEALGEDIDEPEWCWEDPSQEPPIDWPLLLEMIRDRCRQ